MLSVDFWKYVIYGNTTVVYAAATELFRDWLTLISQMVDNDNTRHPNPLRFALYVSDISVYIPVLYALKQ